MARRSDDDSDSESFVTIGTPFEIIDEDQPRKKPFNIEDQFATDSKGRRRFHGAFTGGFSAGFYNSVGSKEGFTPATFTSSRSDKSKDHDVQRPEDFMDDEDFGEFGIAPKQVFTKESFTSEEKEVQRKRALLEQAVKDGAIRSAIPGGLDTTDFVLPTKMSIGLSLLKKMGWKEGQGIGEKQKKKVFGCSLPAASGPSFMTMDDAIPEMLFAPKDTISINFRPKDNFHGLGYSGIDPATAMFSGASSLAEVFKPTGSEKRGIKGQAFGVGAFEEEDYDIYERDNLTDYDMTISFNEDLDDNKHGWSGPPVKGMAKGCLPGFIKAKVQQTASTIYPPPSVPRNFDGRHRFEKTIIDNTKDVKVAKLTAKDRALLLSDAEDKIHVQNDQKPLKDEASKPKNKSTRWDTPSVEESVPNQGKSDTPGNRNLRAEVVFCPPVSVKQSSHLSATTSEKPPNTQISLFKPFSKDEHKQRRYETYLANQKSREKPILTYERSMTEWEKEREFEEFHRAASLYRPMPGHIAARFTHPETKGKPSDDGGDRKTDREKAAAMGMYGALTRVTYEWHPDGLLCKRFNIPEPFPGSTLIGVVSPNFEAHERTSSKATPSKVVNSPVEARRANVSENENENQTWTRQNMRELSSSPSKFKKMKQKFAPDKADSAIVTERPAQATVEAQESVQSSDKSKIVIGPLSHLNKLMDKTIDSSDSSDDDLYDETKRPSMDLFKAIFADSEEEEEDKSSKSDSDNSANNDHAGDSKGDDVLPEQLLGNRDSGFGKEKNKSQDISGQVKANAFATERKQDSPPSGLGRQDSPKDQSTDSVDQAVTMETTKRKEDPVKYEFVGVQNRSSITAYGPNTTSSTFGPTLPPSTSAKESKTQESEFSNEDPSKHYFRRKELRIRPDDDKQSRDGKSKKHKNKTSRKKKSKSRDEIVSSDYDIKDSDSESAVEDSRMEGSKRRHHKEKKKKKKEKKRHKHHRSSRPKVYTSDHSSIDSSNEDENHQEERIQAKSVSAMENTATRNREHSIQKKKKKEHEQRSSHGTIIEDDKSDSSSADDDDEYVNRVEKEHIKNDEAPHRSDKVGSSQKETRRSKKKKKKKHKTKHKSRHHSNLEEGDSTSSECVDDANDGLDSSKTASVNKESDPTCNPTKSKQLTSKSSGKDINDISLAQRLKKHHAKLKRLTAADFM